MKLTLPESPKAAPSAADARRPRRDMFSIDVLLDSNWMRSARQENHASNQGDRGVKRFILDSNEIVAGQRLPTESINLFRSRGNKPAQMPVYSIPATSVTGCNRSHISS